MLRQALGHPNQRTHRIAERRRLDQTPQSLSDLGFLVADRPPPSRRMRPAGNGAPSKSSSPRLIVERASPVILETSRQPASTRRAAERGGLDLIRQDPEQQPTRQMGGRGQSFWHPAGSVRRGFSTQISAICRSSSSALRFDGSKASSDLVMSVVESAAEMWRPTGFQLRR